MKLNFKKIKHLYIIYGSLNALLVLFVLVTAILFYGKYSKLDELSSLLSNELRKTYTYNDLSKDAAINYLPNDDFFSQSSSQYQDDFIRQIEQSKEVFKNIKSQALIKDVHFSEAISGLILDYEDLNTQNELMFDYLHELGNINHGLYYNLNKAAVDFRKKLKEYDAPSRIDENFIFLYATIEIFLQSRNEQLTQNIESRLEEMNKIIKATSSTGNNYMEIRIYDAFQNFTTSYYQLAKRVYEIGINNEVGLLSKINNTYSKILTRIEQIFDIIEQQKRRTENIALIFIGIILLVVIFFNIAAMYFLMNSFNNLLNEINQHVKSIDRGFLSKIDKDKIFVETHGLVDGLESFSQKMINAADVTTSLSSGKTSVEIEKGNQFDVFYNALSKIKQNIENLNQSVREERKKQTNMLWIKSGIEKLTEVMRRQYDNPLLHANEIINMLMKFLNLPIGAIYHLKEENNKKYLEMMASFAYGKEKQMYQKIAFGEGIVGTAASEKKTLNTTNVPKEYFNIVSGFGETPPKNILVSPIKLNEIIYGVVELASLSRFKQEEIEFVEEVCKTVAYSFAISKVYLDTLSEVENANLEIAQLEAENVSLSNEYEDLSSNYKGLLQKGAENAFIVEKLNEIAIIVDLDLDGNIVEINSGFEQFFKSTKMKFLHLNFHEYLLEINMSDDIDIDYIWRDVRAGIQHSINQKIKLSDNEYWLNQHYFPIKDEMGRVRRIKLIAFDLTNKINSGSEISES